MPRVTALTRAAQVFSNVIATPADGLRLVDMRGKQGDVLTLRGDVRINTMRPRQSSMTRARAQVMYDYAKVYQSVCGYDFVLLDRTRCDAYVKSMREFADAELSQRLGAEGLRHLRVVTRLAPNRSASVLVLSCCATS